MDSEQNSPKESFNPDGRPTEYQKKYDKQAFKLALLGATDAQLADFFEVSVATINNWKIEFPSFLESLKGGKIHADATISKSLFKRAKGYEYTETTYEDVLDPRMEHGEITYVPVTKVKTVKKFMPPDPTSMIFWLKNRQPQLWRDRQQLDLASAQPFTLNVQPTEVQTVEQNITLQLNGNGHK